MSAAVTVIVEVGDTTIIEVRWFSPPEFETLSGSIPTGSIAAALRDCCDTAEAAVARVGA